MKNMKLLLASLLICAALVFASCVTRKKVAPAPGGSPDQVVVNKGDEILKRAKSLGKITANAVDRGITLEAQLAANGTIDKEIEPSIRQWLQDGKKSVADYNARIGKYDHLDDDARKIIADFLTEAVGFIDNLNNNGILRIKNPRSQLIASGILLGAQTAIDFYKQSSEQ
jgi:hypothetical protein